MARKKNVKKIKKKEPKKTKGTGATLKSIERAMLSVRLHPVAVDEETKNKDLEKIKKIYSKGNDSVRQHIITLIREDLTKVTELRNLNNFDFYKAKYPKADPGQIRMNIYKDMFNSNTSIEGLIALIHLLGELDGPAPAKLLTHLFTHFCSGEIEVNRILRNASIDALGKSKSPYALNALIKFAQHSDNEKILARLSGALVEWDDKLGSLKIKNKEKLKHHLREVLTREEVYHHQYG
jgi:HEAT repeat protein